MPTTLSLIRVTDVEACTLKEVRVRLPSIVIAEIEPMARLAFVAEKGKYFLDASLYSITGCQFLHRFIRYTCFVKKKLLLNE